jgi:RNA polymerase sigma factor (sigma-70 family)
MDASLQVNLNATDATSREEFLSDLLWHEAAPLIRKVLRQRLGFYLNPHGANPQQPEAENLYQDILLRLLERSQAWLADAEQNPIHHFRNLVITTATNACHDYLRTKAPHRARLKNRLRELLSRHRDFQLWTGEAHEKLCGFAGWTDQPKSETAMACIHKWQIFPDSFAVSGGEIHRLSLTEVVAEVLQQASGPVELEALTKLLTTLLGTQDHPLESLEYQQEETDWQPRASSTSVELRLEGRATLQSLWEEIKQLQTQQRWAVCLCLTDQNGNDLFTILLEAGAVSWTQMGDDLGLSQDQFIELWQQLPMENEKIAAYLSTTRERVNKWRWRGLQQLRTQMRKEK